ncbi:cation:proton antiporter [Azospirillum sp. ST 5-10]|uniref:cation:proton antiporter n=1 Tax=unclassified Azospirillum TaxID=2630922 RepID=UPI003F49BBB7
MEHHIVSIVALIAVAGVAAQWTAWKTGLPAIVVLLAVGVLAGPGLGLLDPSQSFDGLLRPLIGLAVAIVVFEGGLNLNLSELRAAGTGVVRLVAVALPLSWLLGAATGHYVAGLDWPVATLYGAILVVTGPTVIIPLLRQARLHPRPAAYLKWEGILNDPIGAVLAVLVLEFLVLSDRLGGEQAAVVLGWDVAEGTVLAVALGIATPFLIRWAFHRGHAPEILKTPILLACVLGIYTAADALQSEAGLVGATVFGVVLGNIGLVGLNELRRFKESLTVFLVSGLFIVLAADLEPAVFGELSWPIAAATAVILVAVRPVAILLATLGDAMTWRERLLVAWVAPRGIVAAAIAGIASSDLAEHGYPDARLILPMVFAVIAATVVLHGLTVGPLARGLGLAAGKRSGLMIVGSSAWSVALAATLRDLGVPVIVADRSWRALAGARRRRLRTFAGEVLSENNAEDLDLLEIDRVLATTRDDAYNALICTRFAPELGHEQVHQIAPTSGGIATGESASREWRGKILGALSLHHDRLARRMDEGWRFQAVRYTGRPPRSDDRGWNLALVADGSATLLSPEQEVALPGKGALVRFVPPREAARARGEGTAVSVSRRA